MNRKGFTLTEVLVTLAIVSVVAAVVVPALNSQLFKGDVGRATADLNAIKTGIQSFISDVRRYPSTVSDLISTPSTTALDLEGNTYGASNLANWKGPYLDRDLVGNATSGFGGTISETFGLVSGTSVNTYLSIDIDNMTEKNFDRLDDVIEQGIGQGSSTGTLQFTVAGTSTTGTVHFLAVPIQ